MSYNTGRVIYGTLKQVFVDTGEDTTENPKTNDPNDPDYIGPVVDLNECPPTNVPPTPINKITVQIVNNTTQVVVLSNFVCRGNTIMDLSKAYYKKDTISMMPGTIVTSPSANQLDDITRLIATASGLSKNIRINIAVQYKLSTDGSFSNVVNQDVQLTNTLNIFFDTARISGNGTNQLKLVITEHPIPVDPANIPPVVNAGANLSIQLPVSSTTLVATSSDSDGTVVSNVWSQVSGPSTATIGSTNSLTSLMSNLIEGVYIFRMTSTDDQGGVGTDDVQVTVTAANPNPNGIVNIYVDAAMPDTTNAVSQITLTKLSDLSATTILSAAVTKASGVVQKTPAKGTYNLEIQVVVNAGSRSIKVNWGSNEVIITATVSGVYTIGNVVVDEGVNGVIVNYIATVLTPSVSLLYAKIVASSAVTESLALLPWGLQKIGRGNITVSFYSDSGGSTLAPFTGIVNVKSVAVNNITSASTNSSIARSVSADSSVVVDSVQSFKRWDYTLNNPAVAEDPQDKVEDISYTFTLLNGQGYLIIP
jgi:hypothetical protein